MSDERTPEKKLVTKDGIEIRHGQTWRNCDKRMRGQLKEVVDIDYVKRKACLAGPAGLFRRWVSVSRMYKHATGWEIAE